MAAAGAESTVSGPCADLLIGRDPVRQVWQNGLSPLSLEVNSTALRDLHPHGLLPAAQGEKSGTGQSRPAIDRIFATIPAVCRSGSPNKAFPIRQNRIAASLKTGGRP